MKERNIRFGFNTGRFQIIILLATWVMTWSGCASPRKLMSSDVVPAAQGKVETKMTKNGNTQINLQVEHLAKPQDISLRANTFVVWARPSTGEFPQNLGALKVNQDLKGELKTLTPLRSFELFVTAEPSATVQYPSGNKLLWAEVAAS